MRGTVSELGLKEKPLGLGPGTRHTDKGVKRGGRGGEGRNAEAQNLLENSEC